jgi:AcrR family transcriptional regulator
VSEPRIGRPPRVSRDAIVDAALELGFDAATITAVAARLRVEPSTLYRHVSGLADMLDTAADRALREAAWPAVPVGDAWRPFLEAYAEGIWALFERHPGLAGHLRTTQLAPPELLRHSLLVSRYLHERLGLAVREAAILVDTIGDLATDSFLTSRQLARQEPGTAEALVRRYSRDAAETLGEDAAGTALAHEYLGVVAEVIAEPDGRADWWRGKVAYVLDGVAWRLSRPTAEDR